MTGIPLAWWWALVGGSVAHASAGTGWLLPPPASTNAAQLDHVFNFVFWVDATFFVGIIGAMLLFIWKYRRRGPHDRTHPSRGSHVLELTWSVIPAILLFVMFFLGFRAWMNTNVPPADSMDVRVTGQQWAWSFEYPETGITSDVLVVPKGKPVRLTISSVDVIHSLFIPAFRLKKDAVPNRYTVQWFEANQVGEFDVFCAEYCGGGHSRMLSKVKVLEPADYEAWVKKQTAALSSATPRELGKQLYASQGCKGCHTVDGTRLLGPTWKGIWGTLETLTDGSKVKVDDNYIRESITVPAAKVVAGFNPVMPSYQGRLDDKQINALIEYIKSLRD